MAGGYVVMKYTEPCFTKELDLWISTDEENAKAVFASLLEFGTPLRGLTPHDFTEEGYFYQMGNPPFRLDVMMSIPGAKFEDAWPRREEVLLEGLTTAFISRADLTKAKDASGRAQDQLNAENLRRVQDREHEA